MISGRTAPGSTVRFAAWAVLATVLLAAAGVRLLDVPYVVAVVIADVVAYELPMASAIGLALLLAIRLRDSVERRFWVLLAAATGLLLVSETYWTAYTVAVDRSGPPTSVPLLLCYGGAAAIFFTAVGSMTRFREEPLLARVRFGLEVLASVAAIVPLLFVFWTLPAIGRHPQGGLADAVLAAVYPVVGALVLGGTVSVMAGWKAYRWRPWERLTVAALFVYSAGLMLFPVWRVIQISGRDSGPSWFTWLLGAGYALLVTAMAYRLTAGPDEALVEPWPLPHVLPTWFARTYPVVLSAALPAVGWMAYRLGDTPESMPVAFSVMTLAVLLVARSSVVSFEQTRHWRRAVTDPTSGALNCAALDKALSERVAMAAEAGHELSVVVFDIADVDRFESVLGHFAGRDTLTHVVDTLSHEVGGETSVFSLSSEQFAVVLDNTGPLEAAVFARRAWTHLQLALAEKGVGLDIAAGVASYPAHASDPAGLITAACAARGAARGSDSEPVAVYDETAGHPAGEESALRARMRALRVTVCALAEAVDARDPATTDHSSNVAELATALAHVLDLSEEQVHIVNLAALVHDVGKVGVRDEVLLKGDSLTPEERAEVEAHAVLGERILAPARIDDVLPAVRHHHERWDGAGYPDGLSGAQIPLGARILAVCDVYETVTSGRAYRRAREVEDALLEIEGCAGSQLDPAVAATFVRMMRRFDARAHTAPSASGFGRCAKTSN